MVIYVKNLKILEVGQKAVLSLRESTSRDAEVIQYLQSYAAEAQKRCKVN